MADRKITDLTALAAGSQATGDLLTIVDVSESAAADKNKKITVENLFKGIPGDVGIATSAPDGTLHVHSASAGSVTANANADNLVVENNGVGGISILTPNASTGALFFGSPSDNVGAALRWNHTNNEFAIGPDKSGAHFRFNSGDGLERMRIDSSGRLLVGLSTARQTGSGFTAFSQVEGGDSVSSGSFTITSNRSIDDLGARLNFARSKGGSVGSNTVVDNNAELGGIYFWGADGTDTNSQGAEIIAEVDGTPGSNDMPTRLVFGTTADGASSPTERMRINSSGNLGIGTSSPNSLVSIKKDISSATSITAANSQVGIFSGSGAGTQHRSTLYFLPLNTSGNGSPAAISTIASGNTNSSLAFYTNGSSNFTGTPVERMRINDSGEVLFFGNIRKDNASSSLTVSGGNGSSSGANIVLNGQSGSPANTVQFRYGSNESMRIDSSGRLIVGASSGVQVAGSQSFIQHHGNKTTSNLALVGYANNLGGPILSFGASRSTTVGTPGTIVSSGDFLGDIRFAGDDGTDINSVAASIRGEVDGTPGSNDMPGRLTFNTSADGASSVTERMRIDSSGNVGIGTSSAAAMLHLFKGGAGNADVSAINLTQYDYGSGETNQSMTIKGLVRNDGGGQSETGAIRFGKDSDYSSAANRDGNIQFLTNNSNSFGVRMRIDSSGYVNIGNGGVRSLSTTNVSLAGGNDADSYFVVSTASSVLALNRQGSDGDLIRFFQNTTQEGVIVVSGSTVSYNGGHLSRWSQTLTTAEHAELLKGTVMTNLDEMCEWTRAAIDAVLYTEEDELPEGVSVGDVKTPAVEAGPEENEQLNKMAVSSVEGDPNVAGVIVNVDDEGDLNVAMTGDMVIRIAQGTTVARGDLLMSAGDGTAKPQDDDIVRSKTIAKVTSTTVSTTYSDGSYCVPCVLMAC